MDYRFISVPDKIYKLPEFVYAEPSLCWHLCTLNYQK